MVSDVNTSKNNEKRRPQLRKRKKKRWILFVSVDRIVVISSSVIIIFINTNIITKFIKVGVCSRLQRIGCSQRVWCLLHLFSSVPLAGGLCLTAPEWISLIDLVRSLQYTLPSHLGKWQSYADFQKFPSDRLFVQSADRLWSLVLVL